MEIRHLEYFVEVCRELSFTKASKKLHVSQPSISKMIKNLEVELGICLFHRTSKKIELTEEGNLLLSRAQDILAGVENLTMELNQITKLEKGKIRVGIPPVVGAGFFPRLLGSFRELYPGVDIHLVEEGTKSILHLLLDGFLDVGVVCCATDRTIYGQHLLIKDPIQLVVHSHHPLAKRDSVHLKELKNEHFVLYRKDFSLYDQIIHKCEVNGFKPYIICESSQRDFMTEMVAAGLGVTLLPEKICRQIDLKRLKSIPLEGNDIFLELSLIWKMDRYLSHAAQEWLRYINERFEK